MLMRTYLRISLALLMAVALPVAAAAQTASDRFSLNASVGPSFANLGTTLSTTAAVDVRLTDRVDLVGEFGMLPHAPFEDAAEIAPAFGANPERVSAYHWNGNVKVRPFALRTVTPYVTAGLGSFTADTIGQSQTFGGFSIEDRRRASDFATNLGAGVLYRLTDWVGLNADYRTFFVHRDGEDPRVHRFSTGLSFFLK
jgi:opacity protein-like surface antigen